MRSALKSAVVATALALSAVGCSASHGDDSSAAHRLTGTFRIAPGSCATTHGLPSGSYLVVVSAADGKTLGNKRGGCKNPAYTLLRPGRDGGLVTGEFQDVGGDAFDAKGNARADRIVAPTPFGPRRLGFATSEYDEQGAPDGRPSYPAPAAIVTGTSLRVDLRSLVVTYGGPPRSTCKESFGVGCWELGSENATGTYDATTGHFSVQWLTGESFTAKGDSVEVHLEGTFVPRSA